MKITRALTIKALLPLGIAGLLAGSAGMYFDAAPAAHHATHTAMYFDGEGWTAAHATHLARPDSIVGDGQLAMYFDGPAAGPKMYFD